MKQTPHSSLRRIALAGAVVFTLQAGALAVLTWFWRARTPMPVIATFSSDGREVVMLVASVELAWACEALLLGGAAMFAIVAAREWARSHVLLLAGWSQGSAIIVFLVAQLNGIAEVTSLVPLYAIAAGAVMLHSIDSGPGTPTWQRSGTWAAVLGIVPWGVIAFAQIGAGLSVGEIPAGNRVVTLLALGVAVYGWVLAWRRPTSLRPPHVVAMIVGVTLVVLLTNIVAEYQVR